MKLLLIQQKMIGDVLVSSLLCEYLKKHHKKIELHYVVNENTIAVVANNPFIDKIVTFKNIHKKNKLEFYRFLKSISAEKYDVVIDVYGKLESNLITLFSGAKTKIAYSKSYSKFLYTHQIPIQSRLAESKCTTIDDRLSLLAPLVPGKLGKELHPKIFLTPDEIDEAKSFLDTSGVSTNKPIFMLSILGSDPSKTYPFPYMAEVIDHISTSVEATLLFNYIPSQKKQAQAIFNLCSSEAKQKIRFSIFAPSLRKFLGLLYHCQCLIGNEGGTTNMAKALEIPTFAIFAPWIEKKGWHTYANAKNSAVHINDFLTENLSKLPSKAIKRRNSEFYHQFKPSLFLEKLTRFLNREITSNK